MKIRTLLPSSLLGLHTGIFEPLKDTCLANVSYLNLHVNNIDPSIGLIVVR